jgi:hypothetical protein
MNGEQVPKQLMGMWKGSWETYVKTLKAAEEQGDRMLELMLQQSEALQEETKKVIKEWANNYKKMSKSYLDAVEQNISKFVETLEPKPKEKKG